MIVIGIDPSLAHTGVCILTPTAMVIQSLLTSSDDCRPARLVSLREDVIGLLLDGLSSGETVVVVMESQIWSHNPALYAADAAVHAVLQVALWEQFRHRTTGRRFISVNPSQVKKWLGARQKSEVLLQVYKRYGEEFSDHNEADAYALAQIGVEFESRLSGKSVDLTKPQHQVLDALEKSGLPWEQRPETRRRGRKRAGR